MNVTQPAFRMRSSFEKKRSFRPGSNVGSINSSPANFACAGDAENYSKLYNISPPISGAPEIAVSPSIYEQNDCSWQRATRDFSLDK